jgi:steroid 5-alpha reductase family enzyme
MNSYNLLFNALYVAIGMQFIAWLWQMRTKNADIVDITWAAGIVVCTLYYYFTMSNVQTVSYLMLIFPGLWYLRLSIHLIVRYRVSHEDSRYAYLRKHWQNLTQLKFFGFFMFQAILIWIFVLPAFWLSHISSALGLNVIIALALGLISLAGVTVADKQLLNFKQNNAKKVCDTGLWKYSRHPNYFFEWLHWFVYPILLINSPYFYWSLIYPLLMLYFLLKLTGIPFSEQQSLINRGDSYREYQNRTNKFFLWKPKNN